MVIPGIPCNVVSDSVLNKNVLFFASSYAAVDKTSTEVRLQVIRGQGKDTDVTVYYKTRDLAERVTTKPGVETYQALAGEDYKVPTTTSIRFAKGEVSMFFLSLLVVAS